MHSLARLITFSVLILVSVAAEAYSGPGSGVSFAAALWSVVAGLFVVVSTILFWPVRAYLRRRRARAAARSSSAAG